MAIEELSLFSLLHFSASFCATVRCRVEVIEEAFDAFRSEIQDVILILFDVKLNGVILFV